MKRIFWLFLIMWSCNFSWSQPNAGSPDHQYPGIFELLHFQEVVEIDLLTNINELITNRRNEDYHPATLSFTDQEGQLQNWNLKVKARGKFRRGKCEAMPPLKLNFKKSDLADAGLATFDDLKLVTHCISDNKKAKELLIREYLAYRVYNTITPESFRVQFLSINYTDAKTGESFHQWGFIIEDTAQLRYRINAQKTEKAIGLPREKINLDQFKQMALFQYMIGNTDWGYNREHNVKAVLRNNVHLMIPYDFDFSAFVHAPYARLDPKYQQTSIQDRVYLGFPEDLDELEDTVDLFENKKDQVIRTIKSCKILNNSTRRELLRYVESFYENIDDIRLPVSTPKPPTLER